MDPFVGEIRLFSGNFAPNGWALCDGQVLSISQNTALFSLLGSMYGGNGTSTFALPDLRGRAAMHRGSAPGLTSRYIGDVGGSETVTLVSNELPPHTHTVRAVSDPAESNAGNAKALARSSELTAYASDSPGTSLAADSVSTAGGDQPHNNMPPYLTLNYIIALQGIYPSRS
ncbi:phage tail protein [Deinococcus hopiensis]|uniref:Microcystin-dependent protein n=1 Tax=Deinococcus hopiensis KR-140 TaxID=695939 RepID=A0A1W1UT58_9DEIO|nr:tail fiber protein [Deinococcus hopiensis]SMB83904.1 Microcystin-dependent protein [Deinococcus hopiensis KR-140]